MSGSRVIPSLAILSLIDRFLLPSNVAQRSDPQRGESTDLGRQTRSDSPPLAVPDRSGLVVVCTFAPDHMGEATLVDVHLVVVTERKRETVSGDIRIASCERG